jgi:hypothetical protein
MTINPVLSQWDTNGQVKGAQGQEELGRWLRETEGPKQAQEEGRKGGWPAVAVTLGSVFALILVLLV